MEICLKDVQDYVQRSKDALEVAATMISPYKELLRQISDYFE